jgi:hypothetical protein
LTPDRTLKFKGERCVGGKLSKDRMWLGSQKNPRCLKNVKSPPVYYSANKKAWMTSDLFEAELRRWDRELRLQK